MFAPEETLERGHGSCRDFAWLLVQLLRHLGFAARFVVGLLDPAQAPTQKPLDGPAGVERRTSPTCTPGPRCTCPAPAGSASTRPAACSPARGTSRWRARAEPGHRRADHRLVRLGSRATRTTRSTRQFEFEMSVTRASRTPRVDQAVHRGAVGGASSRSAHAGRRALNAQRRAPDDGRRADVRVDRRPGRRRVEHRPRSGRPRRSYADELLRRLQRRFAPGGLLHHGQGKWYPGEPLPRWAYSLLLAHATASRSGATRRCSPTRPARAQPRRRTTPTRFVRALAERLRRRPAATSLPGLRGRLLLPVARAPAAGERRPARVQARGRRERERLRAHLRARAEPGGRLRAAAAARLGARRAVVDERAAGSCATSTCT